MIAAGSWTLKQHGPGFYVESDTGEHVAQITASRDDARLMASARDLLGTLETLVDAIDDGATPEDVRNYIDNQARALIRK